MRLKSIARLLVLDHHASHDAAQSGDGSSFVMRDVEMLDLISAQNVFSIDSCIVSPSQLLLSNLVEVPW
jgi:hypothetical protein